MTGITIHAAIPRTKSEIAHPRFPEKDITNRKRIPRIEVQPIPTACPHPPPEGLEVVSDASPVTSVT
jgi:hypothetical protein